MSALEQAPRGARHSQRGSRGDPPAHGPPGLDEFVACYCPEDRSQRKNTWTPKRTPDGRFRSYSYADIVARDTASLDLFWLRDESLEDSASLPDPHILAEEIADDLRTSLEQIEDILADLQARAGLSASVVD